MTSPISFSTAGDFWLLAADTSSVNGSVALASGGGAPPRQILWDKKATHSECATLETQRLLSENGIDFKKLTHLSINIGPGSFTGIRVGLNLIRTLAYSLSIPVCAFNTLQLLAFKNSEEGESILVATKAVQNFFYVAGYSATATGPTTKLNPISLTLPEIKALAGAYTKVLIEGESDGLKSTTTALDQVELLIKWPKLVRFFDWTQIKPLYIRASEAEEKLRRGLLKPL